MFASERRGKLTLIVLILGALASLMPLYQARAPQGQENLLEGDMTFEVYPDGSIDVSVTGSFEQALEPWSNHRLSTTLPLNWPTALRTRASQIS